MSNGAINFSSDNEYRLKYARGFVPLCECCANGFKDKITEVKA